MLPAVHAFSLGAVFALAGREGTDDLEALTITFVGEDGVGHVVYDNPGPVERMTGDETEDLRCS